MPYKINCLLSSTYYDFDYYKSSFAKRIYDMVESLNEAIVNR